jgi:hypothetical protein
MRKIYLGIAALTTALLGSVSVALAGPLTTSTLGSSIDTVNGTFYDYFVVLLDKYWPFVVGAGILVLVWHFGRRLLHAFN